MVIVSSILAVVVAILIIFIRLKASKKPATAKKIILPPLFMSTGFLMFVEPMFRVTFSEFIESIIIGGLFSILLIKTSKFEIKDHAIYLKRSKAFIFILFGLLVVRIVLKSMLSTSIDYGQLSGMFFLLAFSMILPWRIGMYLSFRKAEEQLNQMNLK